MTRSRRLRPPVAGFNPIYMALAFGWFVAVLWVNSEPSTSIDPITRWWKNIPQFDKLVHFGFYSVMAALLWRATMPERGGVLPPVRKPMLFVFLVPALIGLIDELHQLFVPGRWCDPLDLAANWVGATVAVTIGAFHYGQNGGLRWEDYEDGNLFSFQESPE